MSYESVQTVAPDVTIHYARSSPTFWGSHYILCLHGSTGTHRSTFSRILDEFDTDNLTLVACNTADRPNGFIPLPPLRHSTDNGHLKMGGQSTSSTAQEKPSWTDSLEANADHAATLMQNLFYTPFTILAHEDGAITALHLAAKHAVYVRSIVVWGAVPKITNRLLQALNDSQYRTPPKCNDNPFFRDEDRKIFLARLIEDRQRLHSTGTAQVIAPVLHKVDCPVLILQSRHDPLCTTDQALYLQQNITNSRVVTCDGATTDLHLNNFDWFKRNVQKFIAEVNDN